MLTQQDSIIYLVWTAPFTLNIQFTNPDITYCVDIVNLYSQCGINVTEFIYPLPPSSMCDEYYTFIITPVNAVGNGTNSHLNYTQLQSKRKTLIING